LRIPTQELLRIGRYRLLLFVLLMLPLVYLPSGCANDSNAEQGEPSKKNSQGNSEDTESASGSGNVGTTQASGSKGGKAENKKTQANKGSVTPEAVKGLYVPGYEVEEKLKSLLKIADETEINALVVDAKDAGVTTYQSEVPLAKEIGATTDYISDPKALVDELHENNVYAIARIAVFQDDVLANKRPDLAVKSSATGEPWLTFQGAAWTNAYRKEVWEYNVAIAKEAAEAGFDEIQFDYVRFPSDGPMAELSYGEETFPTQEETIAGFLEYAHGELEPTGAQVSADVFGLVGVNDEVGVGQVVSMMAPHLDVICPMVYPSHYPAGSYGYDNPDAYPYEIVDYAMEDFKTKSRRVNPDIEIRPWLQDFEYISDYGPEEVKAQMKATYDSDLTGWILWNAASQYTTSVLQKENQ